MQGCEKTLRPLCQEEDVLVINDPNGVKTYLYVYRTEEVVYEDRTTWAGSFAKAVSTVTLTSATQMTNLEPKDYSDPQVQIYQLRAGIQGPCNVYVQILAGTWRRGTWKQPVPNSTNYWVGHITQETSPYDDPRFEFFLRHNEYPALAMYNPLALVKSEMRLKFMGKKLECYNLKHSETPKAIGLSPAVVQNIVQRLEANNYPHRTITPRGLEA